MRRLALGETLPDGTSADVLAINPRHLPSVSSRHTEQ